jgi:hypothetical protein
MMELTMGLEVFRRKLKLQFSLMAMWQLKSFAPQVPKVEYWGDVVLIEHVSRLGTLSDGLVSVSTAFVLVQMA